MLLEKEEKGDIPKKIYKNHKRNRDPLIRFVSSGCLPLPYSFLSFFLFGADGQDHTQTSRSFPVRFTTRVETTSQEYQLAREGRS